MAPSSSGVLAVLLRRSLRDGVSEEDSPLRDERAGVKSRPCELLSLLLLSPAAGVGVALDEVPVSLAEWEGASPPRSRSRSRREDELRPGC